MALIIISDNNKFYGFCSCGALLDAGYKCSKKCKDKKAKNKISKYSGRSKTPYGKYEDK